jgi:hypothetical protein
MTTQTDIYQIHKAQASICREPNCYTRAANSLSQEAPAMSHHWL